MSSLSKDEINTLSTSLIYSSITLLRLEVKTILGGNGGYSFNIFSTNSSLL